jgi:thiol-disulfide isomerase/thioredoxin
VKWGSAPDFTLKTINGDAFTLSDNIGKIILIDMMATWCPPCIQQMTQLEDIVEEFQEDILVISIDVDKSETIDDIIDKFGSYTNKWTFLLDDYEENVANDYQVSSIPKILLISQNGNIYYSHVGYTDYSTISQKVKELLE